MKRPLQGGSNREERLSTYFDYTVEHSGNLGSDKARLPVRRFELQALLARIEQVRAANRPHRRLWRWLTTGLPWRASGIPKATGGEIARGEGVPE